MLYIKKKKKEQKLKQQWVKYSYGSIWGGQMSMSTRGFSIKTKLKFDDYF